jgi:polysaccharide export outer membrane protein
MRKSANGLVLMLLVLLAMPALGQQGSNGKLQDSKLRAARNGNDAGRVSRAATDDPSYVIGPEDVLDVSVWKEPELTRTEPVRPDGKISLPLLSDVQASGLTPMQLAASVTEKLRKYLADPQVTVIVTGMNSQRIYILGEMTRPGAYPLLPGMTILQALSSAGGFTQFANLKKIYLMRNVDGRQMKFPFNYKEAVRGRASQQNIPLKAGDTIIVP